MFNLYLTPVKAQDRPNKSQNLFSESTALFICENSDNCCSHFCDRGKVRFLMDHQSSSVSFQQVTEASPVQELPPRQRGRGQVGACEPSSLAVSSCANVLVLESVDFFTLLENSKTVHLKQLTPVPLFSHHASSLLILHFVLLNLCSWLT